MPQLRRASSCLSLLFFRFNKVLDCYNPLRIHTYTHVYQNPLDYLLSIKGFGLWAQIRMVQICINLLILSSIIQSFNKNIKIKAKYY